MRNFKQLEINIYKKTVALFKSEKLKQFDNLLKRN